MNLHPARPESPLESWKEIAAYLKKDTTTAQRWEKEEGLPVHRHTHKSRSSVYAYASEIDSWRAARKLVAEPGRRPLWKLPAFALTILLCLVMVGNGVRPASAGQSRGIQIKQITGPNLDGEAEASITADGRWMATTDWDTGDLAIRDMSNGKIKRLMVNGGSNAPQYAEYAEAPLISPDQKEIVFGWFDNSDRNYQFRIVANQAGAKPRILIRNPELSFFQGVAWAKDGRSVFVAMEKRDRSWQLAWVSTADGSIRVVKSLRSNFGGASVSPDARYILYSATENSSSPNGSIYMLSADGSAESVLAKGGGVNDSPIWTPDGAHALFVSNRTGTFGLWAIPIQNGKAADVARLVRDDIGRIHPMSFTASGTLFYSHGEGAYKNNAFRVDLDPASRNVRVPPKPLSENFVGANGSGGAAWSPDGKSVAFLRDRPGRSFDLVFQSLETGEEKSYASEMPPYGAQSVFWLPGGQKVLFPARPSEGDSAVFRLVDVRTGESSVALRADIGNDPTLALSPDGKTFYFTNKQEENTSFGLFALDVATGERRQIYKAPQGGLVSNGVLGLSPDGKTLVLAFRKQENKPWELCTVSVDGSGFRELYTPEAGQMLIPRRDFAWGHDGRFIFFTVAKSKEGAEPRRLMRIAAEGGKAEFTGLAVPRIHHVSVSPDGRYLSFTASEAPAQELWALDNLLPALKSGR